MRIEERKKMIIFAVGKDDNCRYTRFSVWAIKRVELELKKKLSVGVCVLSVCISTHQTVPTVYYILIYCSAA
jgi:hypothetical protein